MTKHPIKLNTQVIPKTLYSDTNTNQEQTVNSPTSSPSPPSSSPHSPVEATAVQPSSATSSPELPEIHLLCQRLKPSIEELYKKTLNSADFIDILARELTPIIHKHLGPKKTTKKKRDRGSTRKCSICGTISTPEWRRDPDGLLTLCNACGLKEKKNRGKKPNNATAPSYSAQRFHNTVWSQQFPGTSSAPGGPPAPTSRHQVSAQQHAAQAASAQLPPSHGGMSQSIQLQNIPPMYQSFPKPPQAFKIEDNSGVQFNQRYLQSQMVHQTNNMPSTYHPNYQFPVHFNEDNVFGYHQHQSMQNAYLNQCDRPNCPQCLSFYPF